jgi:ribosomal protein S18 acetylase RimI-like enzyme
MKTGQLFGKFVAKSGKNVTFRTIRWEDLDSCVEFINKLVAERDEDPFLGIIADKLQTRDSEAEWLSDRLVEIENGSLISVVAEVDGKLIANSEVLGGKTSDETDHGKLGISVSKEYRNQGVGLQMMSILLDESRKAGLKTVELEVFATNSRAIHVYEKAGFREVGRIPKKIHRKDRFIDIVVMAIEL